MPTAPLDGQVNFASAAISPNAGQATPVSPVGLMRSRITLTSAQILALLGTAVTIAPAPPAGFTIVPFLVKIDFQGGSIAYTNAGGAVQLNVGTRAYPVAESFITTVSPNSTHQLTPCPAAQSTAANPPTDEAAALTISKITNNYAAGNGLAEVTVYYTVESAQGN
jgi:hypothetical protein